MATTNIQIGLAYGVGQIKNEHQLVDLDEILGDAYKKYTITMHTGLNSDKGYVLFKNLGDKNNVRTLLKVSKDYGLTQIIHLIEEAIVYDMKKE